MPGSPCTFLLKYMSGTNTMQGFTIPSFTCAEKHTNFGLKINFDKLLTLKCGSRAPGHDGCLNSVSRRIARKGFILQDIISDERHTLILDDKM